MHRLLTFTALSVAFLGLPPRSLAQASSGSCPCTIRGSVVDASSGLPVPRALVRLPGDSRAALTDAEGRFQFDGLSADSFTVTAEKPGFLGMDFGGSAPPSEISLRLAPDSPPVVLKLTPESIIFGQVSDENGEPLEGVSVTLLFRNPMDGRTYPDERHRAVTDDEGKFRIAGLSPGSYHLAVHPEQPPVLNSNKASPPVGYVPAYYPGVRDLSSAVPLKLHPGKSGQANFTLKREPFVQLSGTVSGFSPKDSVTLVLRDSSGMPESSEVAFEPATGSFYTKWIPPGAYTLIGQAGGLDLTVDGRGNGHLARVIDSASVSVDTPDQTAAHPLSLGSLTVNATSSLSGLHLALQPAVDIPLVVRGLPESDSDKQQSPPLLLLLFPKNHDLLNRFPYATSAGPGATHVSGEVQMLFRGAAPGAYELVTGPEQNAPYYIESATWGSTDLLREDLVLDSAGAVPPIQVVVRDDGATLNGTVSSGDSPRSTQVVLLSDRRKRPQLVPVGANGRFEVTGLAPGVYRVFAVETSYGFDHTDPSFLQKISSKIQEVTLSARQSASINLEVAAEDE